MFISIWIDPISEKMTKENAQTGFWSFAYALRQMHSSSILTFVKKQKRKKDSKSLMHTNE